MFGEYALRRLDQFSSPELAKAFLNSLMTAGFTALLTVALALFLLNAVRLARSHDVTATVRLASIGYALPGGILGLGLLFVLARFDNTLDAFSRAWFDHSTGLLLTGSAAAVILACTIRFLALAEGAIRSGLEKLPAHLDEAARSLGKTPAQSAAAVLLPLLEARDLHGGGAGLRRYDQGTVGDDPAQAVRLLDAGDACLRERLARRAARMARWRRSSSSSPRWCRCCCCRGRWPAIARRRSRSVPVMAWQEKRRPEGALN